MLLLRTSQMKSLAEVDNQPASTVACSHLTCASCAIVDKDWDRMRRGHVCSVCGESSECGRLHFPISIHILVDLIQQAYHSQSPTGPLDGPNGADVGTVLYFCTLREALLNHFLIGHLRAQNVPVALIEKLLDDNRLASQKFGGLFASATGKKWPEAVSHVSASTGNTFEPVSQLMRRAAEVRNQFLHEGAAWSMTRAFSTECINAVPFMVELFVALHNGFTRPPGTGDA